jgi:hypothetical protein
MWYNHCNFLYPETGKKLARYPGIAVKHVNPLPCKSLAGRCLNNKILKNKRLIYSYWLKSHPNWVALFSI